MGLLRSELASTALNQQHKKKHLVALTLACLSSARIPEFLFGFLTHFAILHTTGAIPCATRESIHAVRLKLCYEIQMMRFVSVCVIPFASTFAELLTGGVFREARGAGRKDAESLTERC